MVEPNRTDERVLQDLRDGIPLATPEIFQVLRNIDARLQRLEDRLGRPQGG